MIDKSALKNAIEIVEDKRDKRWIRHRGEDFLNEADVKKLKKAAKTLVQYIKENDNTFHR